VNLIMDSLASLALATEQPTDALLNRKPAGRTQSIMSASMWRFIFVSALYQIIWLFVLYFSACQDANNGCANGWTTDPDNRCEGWMSCASGHDTKDPNEHYTIIFNTFVLMQIFNEINSRQLTDELNIFKGICGNKIFLIIFFGTLGTQVFIVEILNFFVYLGGQDPLNGFINTKHLSWDQWLICVAIAAGGNLWGVLARAMIRPFFFKKLEEAGDYDDEKEMMARLAENPEGSSVIARRIMPSKTSKKIKLKAVS